MPFKNSISGQTFFELWIDQHLYIFALFNFLNTLIVHMSCSVQALVICEIFMDEILVMLLIILAVCWLSEVTDGRQPRLTIATKDGDNLNHRLSLPLLCTPCLSHLFSSQVGLHLNNHRIFSFIQYTWVQSYLKGFPIYDTGFPMYEERFPNVWWKVSQCMRKGFPIYEKGFSIYEERFPNIW